MISNDGYMIWPPDYLLMGPTLPAVDLRFTAPSTQEYWITGDFVGINTAIQTYDASHPVEILDNGTVIFGNVISTYGVSELFNFTLSLNKGDTIDFEVLTGYSTWTFLGTGLKVQINPEPEPGTWCC